MPRASGAQADVQGDRDEAEHQARRIIADSRAAYAACDTYEDRGTYNEVFRGDAGFSEETEFRMIFASPSDIRFAYRELPSEFHGAELTQLVTSDAGTLAYLPWAAAPMRQDSLEMGVVGLTGISGGLVDAILPLLQTGLTVASALDLEEPRLSGVEEIDGTSCDRIEGIERREDGTPRVHVRLWIARDDGLVRQRSEDAVWNDDDARRIQMLEGEEEGTVQPLSTFTTITFHPTCNEPVAAASLRPTDGSLL